jgi:two-component system sensor histidine kinase PilS (NtrC family)
VAGLAAVLLVAMSAAQYAGLLPPQWLRGVVLPPLRVAVSTVGLNVLGFVAVGGLTGYLAERLRAADQHLARASLALADLRALNQTVIDSMTGGLATSAADGTLLSFNRAAEAICGRREREVLGRPVRETLQVPDTLGAAVERTAREGRTFRTDYAFTRPDGRVIELGLTMAPLVRSGRTVGSLFTFQDLTETKQLEREAEIQKRLAAIGQVAAGIAHEIRNPLASMSGSIQVLRTELHLEPEQAELMDIVVRESERLNEIIENFLSYARPRSPEPERIDVAQLLRETALLLRNSPDRLATHEVEVGGGATPVWHLADAAQLRQIVWNLASNGLRAMPGGGRLSLAAARTSRDGFPGLCVEVSDEGVGIPASERDHIFQPFRSSFARGTGLGLAIVHRIVTDAGGDIRVHSSPGAGTRVEIFLPDPAAARERSGPVTPPDALVA